MKGNDKPLEKRKVRIFGMQQNNNNPFTPISREEVYAELEESRSCFERGDYKDFGDAIDEIREKYNL